MRRPHGITVIETAVAVTVVLITAAILVPALRPDSETRNRASCLANMRSWGAAVLLYAQDHDATLPHAAMNAWSATDFAWARAHYTINSPSPTPRAAYNPARCRRNRWNRRSCDFSYPAWFTAVRPYAPASSNLLCPTLAARDPRSAASYNYKDWYSWMAEGFPFPETFPAVHAGALDLAIFGVDLDGAAVDSGVGRMPLARFRHAGTCVMLFEDDIGGHVGQRETFEVEPGFSNLIYVDGHAGRRQSPQIVIFTELVQSR